MTKTLPQKKFRIEIWTKINSKSRFEMRKFEGAGQGQAGGGEGGGGVRLFREGGQGGGGVRQPPEGEHEAGAEGEESGSLGLRRGWRRDESLLLRCWRQGL